MEDPPATEDVEARRPSRLADLITVGLTLAVIDGTVLALCVGGSMALLIGGPLAPLLAGGIALALLVTVNGAIDRMITKSALARIRGAATALMATLATGASLAVLLSRDNMLSFSTGALVVACLVFGSTLATTLVLTRNVVSIVTGLVVGAGALIAAAGLFA